MNSDERIVDSRINSEQTLGGYSRTVDCYGCAMSRGASIWEDSPRKGWCMAYPYDGSGRIGKPSDVLMGGKCPMRVADSNG